MVFRCRRLLSRGCLSILAALSGLACKRPETALRERPAQRVELIQKVQGMTPEEERDLVARVSGGLGLPPAPPAETSGGPIRVVRLTLTGGPTGAEHWGLGKTCLVSMGAGTFFGAFLGSGIPFYVMPTSWKGPGIGAGVGLLLGAAYGPVEYRKIQATLRELGYLPWSIRARWEVLDRSPRGEAVAARSRTEMLGLRPFLHPVPEGSGRAASVRRENLEACARDLVQKIQGRDTQRR